MVVGVRGGVSGSHFYECLDPDIEVSRRVVGQTASWAYSMRLLFLFIGLSILYRDRWL